MAEVASGGLEGSGSDPPEALAEDLWWSGRVEEAIAAWELAANAAGDGGDTETARRPCAWFARECQALGNIVAAAGWLASAELLATAASDRWLELARAVADPAPKGQALHARDAVETARAVGDRYLEIVGLTRLGLARIRQGEFGEGLGCFDVAMAVATSGATARLRMVSEACCDLVLATELTGDVQRLGRWISAVEGFVERRGYPAIMGFCATCAETEAIQGDFGGAEQQLRAAVVGLHETGHAARCVPPAAKLAELLVLQGRLEEAESVLGVDEDAETLLARARLALARGEAGVAASCASRVGRRIAGDVLMRISALAVLAESLLARDDIAAASDALDRLRRLVDTTDRARARARAEITAAHLRLAGSERGLAT